MLPALCPICCPMIPAMRQVPHTLSTAASRQPDRVFRDEYQRWSMEMIMSKSKPITPGAAIFYGGLIAGILDAADGVAAYYFAAGFNPIQVLQFIASGFYGAAAFQKGSSGALVGLLAHFFIASKAFNLGVLAWSPLTKGVLSGKYE